MEIFSFQITTTFKETCMKLPLACPAAMSGGWVLDPQFLREVQYLAADLYREEVGLEEIEAVLLALKRIETQGELDEQGK
jgi:hypothetical protein